MTRHPDAETVRAALALAVRAPSVHNTQPWRWRVGDTTVHLYVDEERGLPHTDPDRRELLISCGAALHHFRVAARSFGWHTVVHRFPNPDEPRHLASVEFLPVTPTADVVGAARAIEILRANGRIQAARIDPATGEWRALSVSSVCRALRHGKCSCLKS